MSFQAVVGAAQLLVRVVVLPVSTFTLRSFRKASCRASQPALQGCCKASFGVVCECQRKRPQFARCLTFRLFSQVADDDFDLVKLAHLRRNTWEGLQQPAASVTDNALYHNAFFLQHHDLLPVERNRFVLDFEHRQRPLANGVIQHHDAPFAAKIGGAHDEVNRRLRGRAGRLRGRFGEMTADGFEAAPMLLRKLPGGLLANAVKLPESVGVKFAAAAETLVAGGAFVALFAITGTILLDLF